MERVDDTQMGIDDLPFKNDVAALSISALTAVLDARALFLSEVSRANPVIEDCERRRARPQLLDFPHCQAKLRDEHLFVSGGLASASLWQPR